MKKIIPTILITISILAGIVFTNSCRQQDDDQGLDQNFKPIESLGNLSGKNEDSLQQAAASEEFDQRDVIYYKDPPPKNGGQWKIKN